MSNASALFRSLIAYGICLPLAVFLGYLLATPLDFTTVSVVAVVVFVLAMPVLLRWHHFLLIAAWNTTALVFFVPGKPPLWMALAAASLGICILQYTLNRNMKFLSVPSVVRALLFLAVVVLLTMRLTGGLGLASFGSDTNGGKKYIAVLAAIAGFFAMINRRVPPKRAGLYVALFFLGGASMIIADLPGRVSPVFNFLFLVFPVTSVSAFAEQGSVVQSTSLISRLSGLAYVGSSVICWLLARYGLRGVLDVTKPWRLSLLCFFFAISMFSGFRSAFVTLVMTFGLLFYLEGMHRTRWLLPLIFVLLASGGLSLLFAPRLPYSIQRSLAVLPFVPVDPVARLDAAASTEWRIQVWRDVLPEIPQYLLVGKGYAFSRTEQMQAAMRGATMKESKEDVELVGNYHNGPLSVILSFGIFGSIAVIWLLAAGIRVLYQNYQFGDPALRNINTFLFGYFVVSVVVFLAVYGALDTDLRGFLGVLGLGISLNGGVAKPAVVTQPKIVFNRFKLHPSVRRPGLSDCLNKVVQPLLLETGRAWKGALPVASARRKGPSAVAVWVVFSSFCSCAGWVLSALHQLNVAGYAVTFLLGLVAVGVLRERLLPGNLCGWNLRRQRRRFGRAFPLAFLILAVLAMLGGAIHAPSNYDAMAYRIPRVLHWLAEGRWHWIHTGFQRVNTRACGIEWLSAPLIAFTKTERGLFLINAVSFLLLPGLVFSVFRRVGVRPRLAWHWMWLLPTGYCYLLQAGSISNDMFSTVYALAAVDFALRAQKSRRASDVCFSVLSAALLTGAKATNLTLLLPWAVAFAPTWRVWLARPLALAAILPPALGASFLPTAALNTIHCGDWTGVAAEQLYVSSGPAWLHLLANGINWTLANVVPPVFPFAAAWNRAADALTPASLAALLQRHFEPEAAHWRLPEIQVEEGAGLGFGLTVLLGLSLLAVAFEWRRRVKSPAAPPGDLILRLVCLAPWVSLLYAMRKLGLSSGPRFLAPYYPLLSMGLLLAPAQAGLISRKWWRSWALFSCCLAGLLLVVSPARPLWPAGWFFQHFGPRLQASRLASLAANAYAAKSSRGEVFAPVIALLPADATVLGFFADDFPETSLWKPFGSRRILHIKLTDSAEEVRQRGIKYLLLVADKLEEPWPEWLKRMDARELQTVTLKMWGSLPPFVWHLVELNPHGADRTSASRAPRHQNEP